MVDVCDTNEERVRQVVTQTEEEVRARKADRLWWSGLAWPGLVWSGVEDEARKA